MPVSSRVSAGGGEVTIVVTGRFDFSLHRDFRDTYRERTGARAYTVDLSRVDYMDSSALGMLLLLREHASSGKGQVVLRQPPPAIRKVLAIANFDKLFPIE